MFNNIPEEMRAYSQWVMWRYEDNEGPKPTKVPYSARNGRLASVTDPSTWATFDEVVETSKLANMYSGIGFVLSDADPFAFIDLDDPYELNELGQYKHDKPDEVMQRQIKIFKEFDSFAERSPSGKGLHLIVKGALPSGRRRSSIEIYSNMRYMTMTGDVYRQTPIKDHNDMLNALWAQMGEGKSATAFYAGLEEAKMSDERVLEIAGSAANGDKFTDLYYNGNWQKYYPSQSEADLALIDIIAFYSENRQQVQNLFLKSQLGQREKSRAQYRINYMLAKCFDRMLPPVDIDGLRNQLNEAIERKQNEAKSESNKEATAKAAKSAEEEFKPLTDTYSVPPGLVGEIARFIYAQSVRPVPEIALAGALGLVAGIVGRSYNVSGTGLNQYVLLLAPTGTGKESIASGIDKLMQAVKRTVPASNDFVGPAKINSEAALIKHLAKVSPCFVSVVGEFGIQLKMMASPFAPPHLQGLLSCFLDLFNKSGEGKILRPSIYSDREKNTSEVLSPALSMIGESTPEKFYEALDESMISSGLLPRFTVVEYRGIRPPFNAAHVHAQPSFDVVEKLSTLCAHALMLNSQHKAIHVQMTQEAKDLFDKFDVHCDENINTSDREIRRHLWNRAHIKSMKLAALIAVGCDPYNPCISTEVATWALNLIVADVRNLLSRFDSGEIGTDNDESKQLSQVVRVISEYILSPWSEVEKYKAGSAHLHGERIIPYSYLHKRLSQISVFRKDRMGNSGALKRSLKTLAERGDIQEVSRATLAKDHKTTAVCYMVTTPKMFGL